MDDPKGAVGPGPGGTRGADGQGRAARGEPDEGDPVGSTGRGGREGRLRFHVSAHHTLGYFF